MDECKPLDPGLFYVCLGEAIAAQRIVALVPNHVKVAWYCYREAAEVHMHPGGMGKLADCHYIGRGVTVDSARAGALFQKAADLAGWWQVDQGLTLVHYSA